jgi:uncharacterized protein YoxC
MDVSTVALVILAGVSLLWTIGFILALVELRQLSQRIQTSLHALELEILPLARETREAVQRLNQVTQGVEKTNARLQDAVGAFREAGENVRITTEAVRAVFGSRLIPVAGALAAVRAGVKMLWKRYARGGRRHE